MSQQTTGIKLDVELKDRLRQLGDRRDRSPHWLIKTAVVEYLEREERYEQERQDDEERWQRYQLTNEAVSQQEAFRHFDKLRQKK
jgi:predicted transcriptional regulator